MAIEAVIWDFGGVFTTSPFEAFNRFEANADGLPARPHPPDQRHQPRRQCLGACSNARKSTPPASTPGFLEESSRRSAHPVPGAEVLPLLSGEVRPRMVAALQAGQGALQDRLHHQQHGPGPRGRACRRPPRARSRAADIMRQFDVVIESSKAGVRKPDPRIYLMMCEALGVEPRRLRLPRRSRNQLQAGRGARHEGDQGRHRGPGSRRSRAASPA